MQWKLSKPFFPRQTEVSIPDLMPNTPIFRTSLRTPILISCLACGMDISIYEDDRRPRHGKMLKADRHTQRVASSGYGAIRSFHFLVDSHCECFCLFFFVFFIMLWIFSSQRTKFLSQPMPVVVSVVFFGLQRSAAAVRYPDICVCFGCVCSTLLSGKDFFLV